MVTNPLRAADEVARRYGVASDGMQAVRLLERFLRNAFRRDGSSAHADRLVQDSKAGQWKVAGPFQKKIEEAVR